MSYILGKLADSDELPLADLLDEERRLMVALGERRRSLVEAHNRFERLDISIRGLDSDLRAVRSAIRERIQLATAQKVTLE